MKPLKAAVISSLFTVTLLLGVDALRSRAPSATFLGHPALAAVNELKSVADVANKVLPSVVNISSTRTVTSSPLSGHPFLRRFFGAPSQRLQRGLGSGVIISSDGYVVTNNHVVAKATKIKVTLADKRTFKAKVVGTDPKSDLAVIKLKGARKLKPLPFGNSATLRLGDVVLAVGNPFGVGQTVTMGIVSAKGRANMGIVDYEDFIQTDAAINPGNSGGALVNMKGQLVGINTAILSRSGGYQGIGFAIPTNMARPIIRALRTKGHVVRGYLGVMIQDVTHELARAMRLPSTAGVLVSDVVPNGPAAKAGLRRGDFIRKIDGRAVVSSAKLRNLVAARKAGSKVAVELLRKRRKITISVKLGRLPGTSRRAWRGGGGSGMRLSNLTPRLRRRYRVPRRIQGVVVTRVRRGSAAAHAGIRDGDVILEANRAKITSVRRFSQIYAASQHRVLILIYRQGSTAYLLLPK